MCLWDHESIFAPHSAALVMSRRVVGRPAVLYYASIIIGRAKDANHHLFVRCFSQVKRNRKTDMKQNLITLFT